MFINVDVELDDFSIDDIIEYVEGEGYTVTKGYNIKEKDDDVALKLLSKSLSEYDLKELLYEYTGMGHFNSFGEVCERLHELLGD
jgi:hypothetical protein